MDLLARSRRWIHSLWHRDQLERSMQDEMQLHLDLLEGSAAAGAGAAEALAAPAPHSAACRMAGRHGRLSLAVLYECGGDLSCRCCAIAGVAGVAVLPWPGIAPTPPSSD